MIVEPGDVVDLDVPFERLALDDGSWVDVARGWVRDPAGMYDALLHGVRWEASKLFRYDHFVEEKRLGSWWKPGQPAPHPAVVGATRALQRRYKVTFDTGCGLIHYRDGGDGQAFHRDTDMRWLDDTVIAVLTLGATRPWLLRPHAAKLDHGPTRGATHDLEPASGDLIVMGGRSQADWQHSVPYLLRTRGLGPRISLQWRHARKVGKPYQGTSYRAPVTYTRSR